MIPLFQILFNPRKAFISANNQFEYHLKTQTNVIFLLASFTIELQLVFTDVGRSYFFPEYQTVTAVLSALISFLITRFILLPLFYLFGKVLKSKAEFIDFRVVLAYAYIPFICLIAPLELYLGINHLHDNLDNGSLMIVNSIKFMSIIWMMYISMQGLYQYSQYGWFKSLVNVIPLILNVLIYLMYFITTLWPF